MISQVHLNLPSIVSRGILKSMIGSLNATAIAYTRMHLRFGQRELPEQPSIDDFNDEAAAVDEQIARDFATQQQGFNVPMATTTLIAHLMEIREFFVQRLAALQVDKNDVALTIPETVKFQMDRAPDANESLIAALATAVGIDPAMLKAAQLKMVTDDAADLKANAGKIIDFLGQYCDLGTEHTEGEIESIYNSLPAHVQYKLMSAAIRAHDKQQQRSMIALLRGKIDAAGDIKLLDGHRAELVVWLSTFSKAHTRELDEYLERGGTLPELEDRTLITSNEQTSAKVEDKIEDKVEVEAKAEPKSTGFFRRAPKPESAGA